MSNISDSSTDALIELLSPDGYYSYLGIQKPKPESPDASTASAIDEDAVKKSYRKLSLKHHPDKPNGDEHTFRVLNRAQKVLLNPKLRQQYDILGIDLDDEEGEEDVAPEDGKDAVSNSSSNGTAQGIVQEIAGMILTGIIQLGVRTCMMGAVSVILVHYKWTLYPTLAFLGYIAVQILRRSRSVPGGSLLDVSSPLLIALGLLLMHAGIPEGPASVGNEATIATNPSWTWTFWSGEALVIAMFTYNSITTGIPRTALVKTVIAIFAMIAALILHGNKWNYVIVVGIEALFAIFVALAFPVMELILESILNEKLRKVGDKLRAHHQMLEAHYSNQKRE